MEPPVRIFSVTVAIVVIAASSLPAQWTGPKVSDSLSVQGYLTNAGGTPIDGNVPITFTLYKGASPVWTESMGSVPIDNGVFSVLVGNADLDTVAFNRAMDLGIKVDTDPEIVPRTPLVTTAFARGVPGFYSFYSEDINWRTWNVVGGAPNNHIENPTQSVGNTIGGGGGRSTGASTANVINGDFNTISGGHGNYISTFDATIGGGINNQILSFSSAIGGGNSNLIASGQSASTIGGGIDNEITGSEATVAGGSNNLAGGSGATVGGGLANRATGIRATVPGGHRNLASGEASFAAGRYARAKHDGTFVWNDLSANDSLISTAANQFLIRAAGGIGINTTAPSNALHVAESVNGNAILANHVAAIDNTSTGSSADVLALRVGRTDAPETTNAYISFRYNGETGAGFIRGNGAGGIEMTSSGSDYAEYLPHRDVSDVLQPGDVVGVFGGKISHDTESADRIMIISTAPIVVGNQMLIGDDEESGRSRVGFVGQVPVNVIGAVEAGDYLLPSGNNNGTAVARRPADLRPTDLDRIAGVAWESSDRLGSKKIIAEVGLDRARATRLAFENELARLWTIVVTQQKRLEMLEASRNP